MHLVRTPGPRAPAGPTVRRAQGGAESSTGVSPAVRRIGWGRPFCCEMSLVEG